MIEKVILLSRNKEFLSTLRDRLKRFGVEVVEMFTEKEQVPMDELRHRYNVIVVDKSFLGHARNACVLVREMRCARFDDPIIAFERVAYDGELFSLAVAGCNFTISLFDHLDDEERLMTAICRLVERISDALSEASQPS